MKDIFFDKRTWMITFRAVLIAKDNKRVLLKMPFKALLKILFSGKTMWAPQPYAKKSFKKMRTLKWRGG